MSHRIPYKSCPLCGGTFKPLRSDDCTKHHAWSQILGDVINWVQCDACGHVFTDGYFNAEQNAALFAKTNVGQEPFMEFERFRFISTKMVDRVLRTELVSDGRLMRLRPGGTWLDVGFGNASLLMTAQEYGFTPVGIDLRQTAVDSVKAFGIEAHCCEITDIEVSGLSVISMADVLEHMPFPIPALTAAREKLHPSGALFVSLPAYGCDHWRLSDMLNQNPYWGELEHYHNFSRDRLYKLLRQTGFEPVSYGISERYRLCMEVCAVPSA